MRRAHAQAVLARPASQAEGRDVAQPLQLLHCHPSGLLLLGPVCCEGGRYFQIRQLLVFLSFLGNDDEVDGVVGGVSVKEGGVVGQLVEVRDSRQQFDSLLLHDLQNEGRLLLCGHLDQEVVALVLLYIDLLVTPQRILIKHVFVEVFDF